MVIVSKTRKNYHCWITNISKMNIVVDDIGYVLYPYKTKDVLDYMYSNLTPEKVQKSIESGDIRRLSDKNMLLVRESAPEVERERTLEMTKASFPNKARSLLELEEKHYQELDFDSTFVSDEEFVEKTIESAQDDHKSIRDQE